MLDNCEHLIGSAAALAAALLERAPKVHLLATSQEPLHVSGETVFRLDPLALPPPAAADAAGYGAVALFVERARAADRRFVLGMANTAAAVEICRRLDGLPLAIELAAARVALLGVDGVLGRLDERLRLLTGGARDAPPRQRTLRAALDWSHALLAADERGVFRRLGVFAGSFSARAAQEVAADDSIDEWSVLDHLGALVDKSLVLVVDGGEHAPRYRLLESARAFALDALAAVGEADAIRRRQARAMQALVERADDDYLAAPTLPWLAAMLPDIDNLRAALAFSFGDAGEPAVAIGIAASLPTFAVSAGRAPEAMRAIERVAPLLDAHASADARARLRLGVAHLCMAQVVPLPEALQAARDASAGFAATGDGLRRYRALNLLNQYAELAGRGDEAEAAADEMKRIESPAWSPLVTRLARQCAARRLRRAGRIAEYRDAYAAEAKLCADAGDLHRVWQLQPLLALAEIALGRRDRALVLMREVVAAIRAHGFERELWQHVGLYAVAAIECGDLAEALPAARDAVAVLRVQGQVWWLGVHLAWLPALRGDRAGAARLHAWAEACAEAHAAPRGPVVQEAHDRLAARLAAEVDADELARLRAEGARLGDDEAVAVALGAADR